MPLKALIQDELLPCVGMNTFPPNKDFNMFELNEISEEIINLVIQSTPEIINQNKKNKKSQIKGLGQFGGGDDDSRKNFKFDCSETVPVLYSFIEELPLL